MKPRIIIESHIPAIPESASDFFDIVRLAPSEINRDTVAMADGLIVRTRTRCDESLLGESRCRFVATATIGTDHLDLPWLRAKGIETVSAPGCNAPAVAQYVFASLLSIFPDGLRGKSIAVVGVGHVGSIVADWATQLGMTLFKCDPPRQIAENESFIPLKEAAQKADIATFHVPFTKVGAWPTYHIADETFFREAKPGMVIINSARGGVVDTSSLHRAMDRGIVSHAIIDCWEGEPSIDSRLLSRADIATPHIAGYSLAGKIRATSAVMGALCRHFMLDNAATERIMDGIPAVEPGAAAIVSEASIRESYSPESDTAALRCGLSDDGTFDPSLFERLRNTYALRREVAPLH